MASSPSCWRRELLCPMKTTVRCRSSTVKSTVAADSAREQIHQRYNYSNDFLDGLAHVTAAVETYQLPQTLIADFKSKLSTVGGQAFPAAVELEDSLGQKFDITSLRGKYVYIDVWASWCAPCIKEIPSLLKLEADTASQTE